MPDLILTNARALDPATALDAPRDLLLRDGLIAAIEAPGAFNDLDAERFDASGHVVAPGFVDIHVHLREPGQTWKETIASGTRAAARGGYTTVVAMPNTVPVNDSVETLRWMLDPARNPAVRLFAMPAATVGSLGERLTDYTGLAGAGAVGFTDDGKPILDVERMREALVAAARLGLVVSQHAEDTRLTGGCSMNEGPLAFRLGLRGMSIEAEAAIVERDIALVREIERTHLHKAEGLRPHLHVQHVSTGRALRAIRNAKAEGLHVTCEAAPHHFALTEEAIGDFNPNAKMNPPLRSERDRQAVVAALLDGTVDCIATDHAPHARQEKEVEFERAPNGITGVETALGLTLQVPGLTLMRAIEMLSSAPARIVKLTEAGSLAKGKWADLTVFNPAAEWTYDAQASLSRSKNSPFDRATMRGRIRATIVRARVVYQAPD